MEDQNRKDKLRVQDWLKAKWQEMLSADTQAKRWEIYRDVNTLSMNLVNTFAYLDRGDSRHFCKQCGILELGHKTDKVKLELAEKQICGSCKFWNGHASEYEAQKRIGRIMVVDGVGVSDGGDRPGCLDTSLLGHSGARFYIQRDDGRVSTTNNLWSFGDIHSKVRDRMPDNAKYITKEQYEALTS